MLVLTLVIYRNAYVSAISAAVRALTDPYCTVLEREIFPLDNYKEKKNFFHIKSGVSELKSHYVNVIAVYGIL